MDSVKNSVASSALWYYEQGTIRHGPVPWETLRDLIGDRDLTFTTRVWSRGMHAWVPAMQVGGLFEEASAARALYASRPRPFRRLLARGLDSMIVTTLLAFVAPPSTPGLVADGSELFVVGLLLVIPVEWVAVSTLGSTPGKALLRITLYSASSGRLSWTQAFHRAWQVWFFGLGAGFIPVVTIPMSFLTVRRFGITRWDQIGGITVTHAHIGAGRAVLSAVIGSVMAILLAGALAGTGG